MKSVVNKEHNVNDGYDTFVSFFTSIRTSGTSPSLLNSDKFEVIRPMRILLHKALDFFRIANRTNNPFTFCQNLFCHLTPLAIRKIYLKAVLKYLEYSLLSHTLFYFSFSDSSTYINRSLSVAANSSIGFAMR